MAQANHTSGGGNNKQFPPLSFEKIPIQAVMEAALDDLERCWVFRPLIDHLVDNAPLHRHFPGQEVVALERVLDLLERLAGVLHVDLVETLLEIQDLLSMKHDVGRLALEAAGRLMQHDAQVWECEPHSLPAGCQQQRCHGGGLADAQSGDWPGGRIDSVRRSQAPTSRRSLAS